MSRPSSRTAPLASLRAFSLPETMLSTWVAARSSVAIISPAQGRYSVLVSPSSL